jgi:hypothetical protein
MIILDLFSVASLFAATDELKARWGMRGTVRSGRETNKMINFKQ